MTLPLRRVATGTSAPPIPEQSQQAGAPLLELAIELDRPFHELKDSLLAEFERAYLTRILSEASMNLSMASRVSGLSRKHIRTLMAKHGIRRADHGRLETIDDDAALDDHAIAV